ncbi:target of EGR1 protein 1 [Brachionichthys hirsutus]|uniref:target of EGR1 protein 1 n=1 Tax=Brachionichthys hirsutus TaxID=412623 RepID=UPI0036043861
MASCLVVPVIDVQNDNFKDLWAAMVLAIKSSSFVALDTELSGLGNRKRLLAESIEDRYKAVCHAAWSRSILSLGIACYKKLDHKAADTYMVQVYNLTLLCSEEYVIEPQSVQFLVQHGFDFNKQYAQGIPYCKGNNKGGSDDRGVHIRVLFTELLRAKKPLVLHNGLIDMVFLYQCFYAQLPDRLATFTAALSEMFPAGIYDTKYITEFELRLTASYLEYAYKKCKLDSGRRATTAGTGPHLHVEFCQYAGHMSSYVDYRLCPAVTSLGGQTEICQRFSAFGWCPNGAECPLSHDTDLIVLQDEKGTGKRERKKKRARGKTTEDSSTSDGAPKNKLPHIDVDPMDAPDTQERTDPCLQSQLPVDSDGNVRQSQGDSKGMEVGEDDASSTKAGVPKTRTGAENRGPAHITEPPFKADHQKKTDTGTHRAGFDAFMTGYIFAYSCTLEEEQRSLLPACLNKIYLSGKAVPLNVVKSTFSKSSKAHVQKMEMVWGGGGSSVLVATSLL